MIKVNLKSSILRFYRENNFFQRVLMMSKLFRYFSDALVCGKVIFWTIYWTGKPVARTIVEIRRILIRNLRWIRVSPESKLEILQWFCVRSNMLNKIFYSLISYFGSISVLIVYCHNKAYEMNARSSRWRLSVLLEINFVRFLKVLFCIL